MMAVRETISTFATRFFETGVDRSSRPSRAVGRMLAVIAAAAFIAPLGGCSEEGGGTGAGTVDISQAKSAAATNPEAAKAAAARGGGLGDAQKGKKGRK